MTPTQRAAAERLAFEQWYDAQPEGRINPWDVWQAAALLRELAAETVQPMRCPEDGGACGAGGYCRPEPQQRKPLSEVWRVEYENVCTPDGDGGSYFNELWSVTDGKRTFSAEYKDEAELLAAALNAYPPAVGAA